MSTALAERPNGQAAPIVTPDQLELVKRTVASGATDAELKLYLFDCARIGVHPLDKLLHFSKRDGRYTPITSIDLMRIRAAETGDCMGISDAVFTGKPKSEDFTATVTVKRIVQGQIAEFTATARWTEYCPAPGPSGKADRMWQKMPHTMLGKCCEALALRKGFPQQLAGLYAREEMDQADNAPHPATVTRPQPNAKEERPGRDCPNATGPEGLSGPHGDNAPVPSGVDPATGEVTDTRLPLPQGAVYIDRCAPGNGKLKGTLVLSNGDSVLVWASDAKAYELAEQLCQDGIPVVVETKTSERWGLSLKKLARWRDPAAQPEPMSSEEIPF